MHYPYAVQPAAVPMVALNDEATRPEICVYNDELQ